MTVRNSKHIQHPGRRVDTLEYWKLMMEELYQFYNHVRDLRIVHTYKNLF